MAGSLKRLRRAPAKFLKTGAGWRAVWSDRSRGRQATYRAEYSPFPAGWGEPLQVNRRPGGMLFSNYEKAQIAESVAILTVALALALANGIGPALANLSMFAVKLLMSFAAVMTGFLLHELSLLGPRQLRAHDARDHAPLALARSDAPGSVVQLPTATEEAIEVRDELGMGEQVAKGLAPGFGPGEDAAYIAAAVGACERRGVVGQG